MDAEKEVAENPGPVPVSKEIVHVNQGPLTADLLPDISETDEFPWPAEGYGVKDHNSPEAQASESMVSEGGPAEPEGKQGSPTREDTRPRGANGGTAPKLYIRALMKGKGKPLAEIVLVVPSPDAAQAIANDVFGQLASYFQKQMEAQKMMREHVVIPVKELTPELKAQLDTLMRAKKAGIVLTK